SDEGDFARWLAALLTRTLDGDVTPGDVLGWDLMLHDVAPASFLGHDADLVSASRLDNLCSCYGAITALIGAGEPIQSDDVAASRVRVAALFDHEEVGSESATGASGTFLAHALERMVGARGGGRDDWLRALADSRVLSADMAHGTHPNYPERHDPDHRVIVGGGPVIKVNVNQRYASDAPGAAEFRLACETAGVPVQVYAHRNDLPCGSTIGPITAAGLGVNVVDVGMAQLAMHSARELMGRSDVAAMVAAFGAWLDLAPAS
ncbi:MAG TPA: M18 family aminopeptidase, partial [Microthrixaceae bacterium]|nr:M18 family aminopeptidase [Microthrixaceae bacterium]